MIQFTVKHEQNIDCGGDHIKLSDCKLNQSPYNAMNLDEFNKAEQLDEFTKAEELDEFIKAKEPDKHTRTNPLRQTH